MTDDLTPTIDGKPSTEDDPNKGIQLDSHGDPVLQGTRLIEKESVERVIDGLRIAAEAAAHLVKSEPANSIQWRGLAQKLDQARRVCVQHAGLGLVMREKQTQEANGDSENWRAWRDRFRYGITQASGGCRQIAVCFRMDLWWSRMADNLELMEIKLRPKSVSQLVNRRPKLILPGTVH